MFDCLDGSDEDNCEPLSIDEESYRWLFLRNEAKKFTKLVSNYKA